MSRAASANGLTLRCRRHGRRLRAGPPAALISYVPSFYDFAIVCQSLGQTQSRLQMAETVGAFLAKLDIDEAEIAARLMAGRAVALGAEEQA